MSIKTRFAPSPTGHLHLGNARTALFNALLGGGEGFLLRIEDTDPERSRAEYVDALIEDLHWLGVAWSEGPDVGGANGPYAQSARGEIYARRYAALEAAGRVYLCFCSEAQLALSRKLQRSAGQAPRYSGTCAHLSPAEVQAKLDQGLAPTLRFRVPAGRSIEFDDLVRGPLSFRSEEIGDFIIRRADATPAFFFTNAVDDALMGVTHVLRGEDHLTNTPRQLLLLEALGLPAPRYGHISMIVGEDGSPLSKRHGSRSLRQLREEGFLPGAVVNYLARLGHKYEEEGRYLGLGTLAREFAVERLGKAPARFDEAQLRHWQQEALAHADADALWEWMEAHAGELVPEAARAPFVALVRPNLLFPQEARRWAEILYADDLQPGPGAGEAIAAAGRDFYVATVEAFDALPDATDFKALADAVKTATGHKGKALFMPLRAALTGELHGPQMGDLMPLLDPVRARARLVAAVE